MTSFEDLQQLLGKRKFNRNIKKAAKALASNVKSLQSSDPVHPSYGLTKIDSGSTENQTQPANIEINEETRP